MKIRKVSIVLLGAVMALSTCLFGACQNAETTDYGTLTIADMTVDPWESAEIAPVFSVEAGKEKIVYLFDGSNIVIADGKVTGRIADTVTTVVAKTAHHETAFRVTVNPTAGYGTIVFDLPRSIYANYPARSIQAKFTKPAYAEKITYTVEQEYADTVKVENGMISAVGNGFVTPKTVKITATTSHHTHALSVTVSQFEAMAGNTALGAEASTVRLLNAWKREGGKTGGVLFVGDSFFDTHYFWTNFYTTFQNKNAYTVGISSTTTDDWEVMAERLVYPINPKVIALHCGTNNIFDDGKSGEIAAADIIRLLEQMHKRLPKTEIYYYGIEPRLNVNNARGQDCNERLKAYCAENAFVTYIDSPAWCYQDDGTTIDTSFYKKGDTVHPAVESYSKYIKALEELGVTFATRQ